MPEHWDEDDNTELLHELSRHSVHVDGEDIFQLNAGWIHPNDLEGLIRLGVRFPEIEKVMVAR